MFATDAAKFDENEGIIKSDLPDNTENNSYLLNTES